MNDTEPHSRFAADFLNAVSAGTMLSKSGRAMAAPAPRSIVRRVIAFLLMIICCFPCVGNLRRSSNAHLNGAVKYPRYNCGPAVVLRGRVFRDPADHLKVMIFNISPRA